MQSLETGHENNCESETSSELDRFIASIEEGGDLQFAGVRLTGEQHRTLKAFHDSKSSYTTGICKSIQGRFDDIGKDYFKAVHLLDTKLWPRDKETLTNVGVNDVRFAVDHFHLLLLRNNIVITRIMTEWTSFKLYWAESLQHHSKDAVWRLLLSHLEERFPNFAQLIRILLVFQCHCGARL